MPRARFAIAILTLLCGSAATAEDESWRWSGAERVVVFADVHGAYEELVGLLRKTGVIDAGLAWAGGRTHLVSTGDLVDRGRRSRDVMDLLMRLQGEAAAAGGQVHVLLGNHELMNLTGDLRYVSADEFLAFAKEEPPGAREAALANFMADRDATPELAALAEFNQRYPPGFFGLQAAFAPDGRYGRWLLERPLMIVIDRTAFTHGGLPPLVADLGLAGTNRRLRAELGGLVAAWHDVRDEFALPAHWDTEDVLDWLREQAVPPDEDVPFDEDVPPAAADRDMARRFERFQSLARSDVFDADGPLWYRGSALCHPLVETPVTQAALDKLDVDRVVVGHSPTADHRVDRRMDGRVIVLDTGMLGAYYNGVPAALVIDADGIDTVYGAAVPEDTRPDDDELETLLRTARIVDYDADSDIAQLEDSDRLVRARFVGRRANPDYRHEVAAYRLDRLLGLDVVPVTVERRIDRQAGALVYLPDDVVDENQRTARGLSLPASCATGSEFELMYAFDALIGNDGRTRESMLYSGPHLRLRLVDFDRAFTTRSGLPGYLQQAELYLGPELERRLGALDEATLVEALDGILSRRQIRALLKRRDTMLTTWPRKAVRGQSR